MTPKITMKPIEWLKPYGMNAKQHPDDEIGRLAATIKRFGWDQPIVTEVDGTIIKGHGRRLAALKLGMSEVPVLVRADLSKAEADAARIADNAAFGMRYDTRMMQDELRRLTEEAPEIHLDDLALSDKDRTLLLAQLDEANTAAILADTISEIERVKEEEAERIAATDKEQVAIAKALGFARITKAQERALVSFLAEAEAATGKQGADAFIEGLTLAVQKGLS